MLFVEFVEQRIGLSSKGFIKQIVSLSSKEFVEQRVSLSSNGFVKQEFGLLICWNKKLILSWFVEQ